MLINHEILEDLYRDAGERRKQRANARIKMLLKSQNLKSG